MKRFFSNLTPVKIGLLLLSLLIVPKILTGLFKPIRDFFAMLGTKATDKAVTDASNNDNSGNVDGSVNQTNRGQVTTDVANKIQVAIHDYSKRPWFLGGGWDERFTEDEDEVIAQLNRLLNATEAITVSNKYRALMESFGNENGLLDDVYRYLENSDIAKIKSIVKNNLR